MRGVITRAAEHHALLLLIIPHDKKKLSSITPCPTYGNTVHSKNFKNMFANYGGPVQYRGRVFDLTFFTGERNERHKVD